MFKRTKLKVLSFKKKKKQTFLSELFRSISTSPCGLFSDVSVLQWVSVAGSGSCTRQQKAVETVSIVHMAAILNTMGAKIYIFLDAIQTGLSLGAVQSYQITSDTDIISNNRSKNMSVCLE